MTSARGLRATYDGANLFFFTQSHAHDLLTHFFRPGTEKIRGELRQVATDVDDQKRSSFHSYSVIAHKGLTHHPGNQLLKDLASWLSPPDPFINFNTASDAHHEGTGMWFIESCTFQNWRESSSLIWINGKRASFSTLSARSY